MEHHDHHGILMHGIGRWLVYSRPRAWLGMALELPRLLRGIDLPRGARCLDIATGIGWAAAGVTRLDPAARIVALDYDGTILPDTREYLRSHGAAPNVSLCRGDGKRLPFRDATFDLTMCLYGLHHFRGYLDALREIGRVLKPGGVFALIDPIRKPGKPPGGHHGTEVLMREEVERMLAQAGFEMVRSWTSFGTIRALTKKAGASMPLADAPSHDR